MKAYLAVAAILASATCANAATVLTDGSFEFQNGSLTSGNSVVFEYTVGTPLQISDISISGTGFSGGSDLANVVFTLGGVDYMYSTITTNVGSSSATGVIPAFVANSDFSLTVTNTASALPIQYTFAFVAADAAVPLPAAGGLLAAALAGLAFARTRKAVAV